MTYFYSKTTGRVHRDDDAPDDAVELPDAARAAAFLYAQARGFELDLAVVEAETRREDAR
jgi:hypothetical protein